MAIYQCESHNTNSFCQQKSVDTSQSQIVSTIGQNAQNGVQMLMEMKTTKKKKEAKNTH